MPCPQIQRDILHQLAFTPDEQVSRNLHIAGAGEVVVRLGVEAVQEEVFYPVSTESIGRKTDVVNDQKVYGAGVGPPVMIGGEALASIDKQPAVFLPH